MDLFNETLVDDVFWSDSSDDGNQDAPELTSSEESEDSSDADDLPDLIEDSGHVEEVAVELDGSVPGQSGRWLSARLNWWQAVPEERRAEPWLLDDTILSSCELTDE